MYDFCSFLKINNHFLLLNDSPWQLHKNLHFRGFTHALVIFDRFKGDNEVPGNKWIVSDNDFALTSFGCWLQVPSSSGWTEGVTVPGLGALIVSKCCGHTAYAHAKYF